jgi:hypothetical protein
MGVKRLLVESTGYRAYNLGGVYGRGNIGPFIFSLDRYKNGRVVLPDGDVVISGPWAAALGRAGRLASPVSDPRFIGGWYVAAGAAASGGYLVYDFGQVQSGLLFGTRMGGNTPLFNSNETLRLGWSYIRANREYVFRIGGKAVDAIKKNPHINLWPPSWWFR